MDMCTMNRLRRNSRVPYRPFRKALVALVLSWMSLACDSGSEPRTSSAAVTTKSPGARDSVGVASDSSQQVRLALAALQARGIIGSHLRLVSLSRDSLGALLTFDGGEGVLGGGGAVRVEPTGKATVVAVFQ